jgi:hypothetical protein
MKAVASHAAAYRYVTEQNVRPQLWPIIDVASNGGSYCQWWTKFWLGYISKELEVAYAKAGVPVTTRPSGALAAVVELSNSLASADTAYVTANLDGVVSGDVFLMDMSDPGSRDPLFAGFVRQFASPWPQQVHSVAAANNQHFVCDCVSVPGAGSVAWLNGGLGNVGAVGLPAAISTTQMLSMARLFVDRTGSYSDALQGLEVAVALAFNAPYANALRNVASPNAPSPCVERLGRALHWPLARDNTLVAYLRPFYDNRHSSSVVNDLLITRTSVLRQELVYYYVALSQSHSITLMVANVTCDMLAAGMGSEHLSALQAKEGASRTVSKFDRLVANTCAHVFGFIPYSLTLSAAPLDCAAHGVRGDGQTSGMYYPMWSPQPWLGYEVCEVMLMMPEGYALPGPGATFKSDLSRGSPLRDRVMKASFVRLFRSLPVLDQYVWLGDGGQANGAAHLAAGHGANYYLQLRGHWNKPYVADPPSAPSYLPLLWSDQANFPGVLVPGQFPTWNEIDETNMAWGIKINPNKKSHELVDVLQHRPDVTRVRTFVARNGFMADDPTRVVRTLPNLSLYDVMSPGAELSSPVAVVERPTLEVEVAANELVAEANSMADFVEPGHSTHVRSKPSRPGWTTVSAKRGRARVSFGPRQRMVRNVGSHEVNSGAYAALARLPTTDVGARDQAVRRSTPPASRANQMAQQKLSAATSAPSIGESGPTDDELITQAIKESRAERERMQSAGAEAAPPLKSYAEAVAQEGATRSAVDEVTARPRKPGEPAKAVPHPAPQLVSREVEGKPVAVPQQYVAPPSASSEDMLAAVARGAGVEPSKRIRGQGN